MSHFYALNIKSVVIFPDITLKVSSEKIVVDGIHWLFNQRKMRVRKCEPGSLLSHYGRVVKSQSLITNSNCIWVPQNVVLHPSFLVKIITLT